jgi:hypothetical protein
MADSFGQDQRGAMVEKFAAAAALIALVAVVGGTTVEQMASVGRLPTIAVLSPDQYVATRGKPNAVDEIDYMATGSISGRVVLDPCTGRQKSP